MICALQLPSKIVFRYWNSFLVDMRFKSVYLVELSCSNIQVILVSYDIRQKIIIVYVGSSCNRVEILRIM